ncbi:MAG: hypothetical protein QOE90_2725 [Thermoplasmata archaeon]|jgi:hypothetical protein|nr:hypothetical protein [Thermoplasmata archaeon]
MKTTTLVLAALLLGSAAVVLAPGASAIDCFNTGNPTWSVNCQLDNAWIPCNGGGYASVRYVIDHGGC